MSLDGTYRELGPGRAIFYGWGEAMHTRLDVILCHRPQAECEEAFRKIVGELRRLESLLSRFEPSSDIARVNAGAADRPVKVEDEVLDVLKTALRYGAMTGYAFDATYASKKGNPADRLYLDPRNREVLFRVRGVSVDLGALGKGYALQKAQEMLLAEGWSDFLLNFGNSSVCARGDRPGARGWTVGVENQRHPGSNALEITLFDRSLTTSGNTGRHDGHIFSSARREYIRSVDGGRGVGSVSVVTAGPLEGEALSTALFAALHDRPDTLPDFMNAFAENDPGLRAYGITYTGGNTTVNVFR
jgi:thiamine biosynthesis lipoprotein